MKGNHTMTTTTDDLGRDVLARLDALRPDELPHEIRDSAPDLIATFTRLSDEAELLASTPGKNPTTRKAARERAATCREIVAQLTRLTTPQTQTRKETNQ